MILQAPAKINWFLLIEGKREDGYHAIVSAMQKVDLYDTLTFEPADDISLTSDLAVPAEENLVLRAARLLKEYSACKQGADIGLKKEIPVAAGLGGGSSDAASTLIGLNRLWRLGLTDSSLMELGARLGSDVPFFIGPPFSLAEGRGEKISKLTTRQSYSLLLVKPELSVATSWAYQNFSMLTKKTADIKLFCQALERKDFYLLQQMLFNDLENAVVKKYPVISAIKYKLLESGAETALMSGSGSTVFGVFSDNQKAQRAAEAMGPHWRRVVQTIID